jgi:hypothetical protein
LLKDGTAFAIKVAGRCLHALSHFLWLVFLSTAVNFIPNKQSPSLSLLVDCPMLFGIEGLQECSWLLELLEDGTAFAIKVVGRCLHTLSHFLQLVFLFIAVNFIPNKQSLALSLLVDCPMLFGSHRRSVGVQSIVGITGGRHCFCN